MTDPAAPHPILDDPDGHFPYKKDQAIAGHANPYFGVHDEAGKPHQSAHIERYVVMPDEATAAELVVNAQAALHAVGTDHPEYQQRRDEVERTSKELMAVRQKVRADRSAYVGGYVSGDQFISGRG